MRTEATEDLDEDDFFEMANLPPEFTGLPMVVWVSERGHSRHDVRVKVALAHGRRLDPSRMCSVSVRPAVDIVAGPKIPPGDLDLVRRWVELNRETIIEYWNGHLYTNEMVARVKRI